MRTTRLAFAALTALVLPAVAPPLAEAQEGLQLGFRAGVSVASASVHLQETFSKSNRTGFAGGIFLNYDASVFGFQIGGQYTQKGVDLDLGNVVNNFKLSYVEIPAVIKLGIPLGAIKPSVFGGAALGFKTGCDRSGNDCGGGFKGTDFLGIAGADLAIHLEHLQSRRRGWRPEEPELDSAGRYRVQARQLRSASERR